MSFVVALDTGVLGFLARNDGSAESRACQEWLEGLFSQSAIAAVPEVVDYELRRGLLRVGRHHIVDWLDDFVAVNRYVPLTTAAMRKAADFWADVRVRGLATAADNRLDADAILAAQVSLMDSPGDRIVVATTNVRHLSRFPINAQAWRDISL